jgi:hypothetical protein
VERIATGRSVAADEPNGDQPNGVGGSDEIAGGE